MFRGGFGARRRTERRPGGPAGPYRGQSSNPSIRSGGSSNAIVPYNPPTPAAPGVATQPTLRAGASAQRPSSLAPRANTDAPLALLELDDLLTPGPTARENAEAALRLGVKPPRQEGAQDGGGLDVDDVGEVASAAVSSFVQGVNEVAKRAREAAQLPSQRVDNVLGRKTLGTPTLGQLLKAASKEQVRVNHRGKITIPATRQAARRLDQVREQVRSQKGPLPGLDPEQNRVAQTVLRVGDRLGATRKEKLAAIETGLVETTLRNLGHGDRDSEGWRQERSGDPRYHNPRNVKASAQRFFEESVSDTGGTRGAGMTAGQLAQTIQASAHPERYDERRDEALPILNAYERGREPGPRLAAQLTEAVQQAQRLGLPTQARGAQRFGPTDKQVLTRFRAAQQAAQELEQAKLPYVWGGGHGDPQSRPTGGGLDCSGAVSYVLNKMGVMDGSLVSGDMGRVLKPGPGAVTVFYNPTHTFMKIGNRFFGTSRTNPGGGAGFIEGRPDDLSKYNVGHVPGLGGKVALQLGVDLAAGGATSGGGIVYSPDGTTATVTGGANKGAAGFSDRPIVPSVTQLAAPTAASSPLPAAFTQFQLGGEGEAEGGLEGDLGVIERLLRRRRL